MRSLRILLVLSMLFSVLVSTQHPEAAASAQTAQFNPQVEALANDIVAGTIAKTTPIYVDGAAYTVAEVEIASASKGSLEGRVLVEVRGGFTPDGYEEVVSHQPKFVDGDDVSLALVLSERSEFAEIVGSADLPVYSVVRGIDGVDSAAARLRGRAGNYGDFLLTGDRLPAFPSGYRINPADSGNSASDTISAVNRGVHRWEEDPGSAVDLTYLGTSPAVGFERNGINLVSWDPNLITEGVLAQATWWLSRGEVAEWDIRFALDWNWSTDGTPGFGEYDVATVMLHEAGHILGLTHTRADAPVRRPGFREVMHPGISSGTVKPLGDGDRSGMAFLYPRATRITSPSNGSVLQCGTTVFEWDGSVVGQYSVRLGATPRGTDYAQLSVGSDQFYAADNIPANYSLVYLDVYWRPVETEPYTLQHQAVYRSCLPPSGFRDVLEGVYYEEPVIWAVENNITNGTSAITFSPRKPVTRAQMATFLWRHAGEPAPTASNPFVDIAPGLYYSDAVVWLAEEGITNGTSATTFSPHRSLTREQLALLLWRYADRPAPAAANPFGDVPSTSISAEAITWLAETGITTGKTATTFGPVDTLLREQAVTFLYRYDLWTN